MSIKSVKENIDRTAEILDQQLREVKKAAQAIANDNNASHIVKAFGTLTAVNGYINYTLASGIDMIKVYASIAAQFGDDDPAAYAASVETLRNTLIPAFLTKVFDNQSIVHNAVAFNSTSGDIAYTAIPTGARNSVMANVNAILAEFD